MIAATKSVLSSRCVRRISQALRFVEPLHRDIVLFVLLAVCMTIAFAGSGAMRFVTLLVLAPVAEEVVFRAGIHEALLRRVSTRGLANGLSAAFFAACHVIARGDGVAWFVVVPGLWIGCVYERTRRIRFCIACHAAMNALWLLWNWTSSTLAKA